LPGAEGEGTPAGFALGNATGDSNWTFWLLWAHGGKMVDAKNNVVINSPETIAALEYAKQLYDTFIPGTLSWLDPNNNKAFLDGQIALTNNGISVYYARRRRPTRSFSNWRRTSSTIRSRWASTASRAS
jgi:multiple sugar transport system substrate-binding protein